MSDIQVRPATLRDAKAIAQIHTLSAQTAYRGIVPEDQLKIHVRGQTPSLLARSH